MLRGGSRKKVHEREGKPAAKKRKGRVWIARERLVGIHLLGQTLVQGGPKGTEEGCDLGKEGGSI